MTAGGVVAHCRQPKRIRPLRGRPGGGALLVASATALASLVGSVAAMPSGLAAGTKRGDRTGSSVAGVGDFNGDGFDDVLVGAPGVDAYGADSGEAYLLFGELHPDRLRLDKASAGLVAQGRSSGDRAGSAVAAAGDFNGDGLADVIVGAPGATFSGRESSGAAYVVFGGGASGTFRLDRTLRGLAIYGADAGDRLGTSVAGAGDVDGDGLADVIIGSLGADAAGRDSAGSAYVVFGRPTTGALDLAAAGSEAATFSGSEDNELAGKSVAGVGDMNGDGLSDIAVGAPGSSRNGGYSGAVYVVWGSPHRLSVDLGLVGSPANLGIRILGASTGDDAGWAVSAAGDANGDGTPDVAIGARGVDGQSARNVGAAYVVFGGGSEAAIDLGHLDQRGYAIQGSEPFDLTGAAVSSVGDVDGDGRHDLAVGAPLASRIAANGGAVYVVPGRPTTEVVSADVEALYARDGTRPLERLGRSVAGAGDFNRDGTPDLLVGAPTFNPGGRPNAGTARLILLIDDY